MSDTPRTDDAYFNRPDPSRYDLAGEMKIMERELNSANTIIRQQQLLDEENFRLQDRIKRLEEALDTLTLVVGLTPIRGNLAALQEAMDQSRAVLKAKEAKP